MTSLSGLVGLLFFFSELGLAWRRRSSLASGARTADGGSLSLLWRVIGCAIATGVTLAAFGVGPRLPGGLPWDTISLVIFVGGTALRWWAIQHLGRFFTVDVAVADDHRVVDTGPYRLIRHPSYTGLLLQFVALGLALMNWLSLTVILLPIWLALLYRIRIEEKALLDGLGAAYARYVSGTKRLVPLIY